MGWFRNRAVTDAVILLALFLVGFTYFSHIEAFELLVDYVEDHESWQLDEAIVSLTLIGIAGFIYAIRRNQEKRAELKKRKAAEADVSWLAQNDALTELPNRRFLNGFLEKFDNNSSASKQAKTYGIFSIDLDGFKQVNDLHGHAGGDALLKAVARRLAKAAPDDLIMRVGGDEFLVIAEVSDATAIQALAHRMSKAVCKPMSLEGIHAEVGVSIGFVVCPDQTASMDEAVRCADIAMYTAKSIGGNAVTSFTEDMLEEAAERARLEGALKMAVRAGDIVPHYQPLMDLETDTIYGFEVLARWTTSSGEIIPPTVFIPVAERTGLITDLSEQLLRQACQDAAQWPSNISLAFNLSPTQLSDKLLGLRIITILKEYGLLPSRLEIEITESAMIQDGDSVLQILSDLQAAGIRTALDDFGTGYSSLSQIAKFNFDRIKIDRSFVTEIEASDKQLSIVKAIIALGEGLNVFTTAEGVETQKQLAVLKALGCNCGQGFLLGRPMPANEASSLLGGDVDAKRALNQSAA
ncbi:MAG: EAL domain-containing protein [Hyphomicrobiales bacterium]|jgi:diguanylate cyclase (GGDEF)-like protein